MRNNNNGFESSDELSYIPSTDYDDDDFEDEDSSPTNTRKIYDNVASAQDDAVESSYKSKSQQGPLRRV